ncbi:lipocalin family protein [Oceanihabitans sp. 2_MG-2023]|uniref:lipocalin family protein n=1 Tax=Oceanihabitans sp. 2_MG-2023 TaxID=3062661 RepID=UPI0026E33618|nr:lipocalin family protein [Oceanihabitans sp. 2_MG-2023]MDO6595738.1 lipocalin family protein [Oceanihabitans sp. 2_MG-2023]
MKTLKLIALSILFSLTFFSCDNDDDSSNLEPTTQELLAHKWFIVIEGATPCTATSYFDFNTDGTFATDTFYEHSVSGDCTSGGYLEGTYSLLDDNVTLIINLSTSETFIIELISTTDLVISPPDEDGELVFTR